MTDGAPKAEPEPTEALRPLREAFPFSFDTVAGCLYVMMRSLTPGPDGKPDKEELEDLQAKALLGLLALGAAARVATSFTSKTENSDALVFAILAVLYTGLAALLIWGVFALVPYKRLRLQPDNPVGPILGFLVGCFLFGIVAYILAIPVSNISDVETTFGLTNANRYIFAASTATGIVVIYGALRLSFAEHYPQAIAFATAAAAVAFLGFVWLIRFAP